MAAGDAATGLRALGRDLSGDVVLPGDESWDTARLSWNLAVDQGPVAVVYPESADDVVAIVGFAAGNDLRIAFNAGGHNAGPIDWTTDALLLKTERMRALEIDAQARRARAEAGVLARPVSQAAGEHGLCYLCGTSPDVGIVGYTLGGGFSWMIRRYGLAANSVLAVELVTADGRHVRADADHEPDLFWAVRGGGGNFGAVTAIEFALYPIPEMYAGCFFWPIERATEILNVWREWVDTVPDECESIGRMLQLPDVPFLPEHVRGRSFVLVEPAFIGSEEAGAALVQPFRDLEPEIDTVAMMPTSDLSLVNMDPDFPLPYAGDGILLDDCTPETIDTMVENFVGLAPPACRAAAPGRRPPHRLARPRVYPHDRPAVHHVHVRPGRGRGDEGRGRASGRASDQGARSVGQREAVPQLHGVARRPAIDLPRAELRPAAGDQGEVRPAGHLRRESRHPGCRPARHVAPAQSSGALNTSARVFSPVFRRMICASVCR